MKVKCIKRENIRNTSLYTLEQEDGQILVWKSYKVKEEIKKKNLYITNMLFKNNRLTFIESEKHDWLSEEAKKKYEERVTEFLKDGNQNPLLVTSHTPKILSECAKIEDLPIIFNKKKCKEISKKENETGHGHHHGVTKKELLLLPKMITSPVIVLRSKEKKERLIVLTNTFRDDERIMVAIHCKKTRLIENEVVEIHRIASLYPKNISEESLNKNYILIYP